ncbi:hypothetical protein HDU79_011479 [Rhizoclosmatium sp. JEL0117]|nr:hypothetical protein HDU79_011479 [Rhizoclosmatium sp. JEL0117]
MVHLTIAELAAKYPDAVPLNVFDGLKKRRPESQSADEKPRRQKETKEEVAEVAPVKEEVKVAEPVAEVEAPVQTENLDDMFGALKKKKKKKDVPVFDDTDPAPEQPPATENVDEFNFGDKKKKKKKHDLAEFEQMLKKEKQDEADAAGDDGDDLNGDENDANEDIYGNPTNDDDDDNDASNNNDEAGDEIWLGTTRDYTYAELLSRVFRIIRQNNPDLIGEKKKYTLVPPQVMKEGTKKSIFANVVDIARRMRREPDHLIQYLFSELGTSGSIDGAQRLVMKGRFQQKHIENVLKRYIVEYVTCKTCRSGDTILTKENRLFFLQCQSCGSTKSVSAIKTGFLAQATKRSAMRNAAA